MSDDKIRELDAENTRLMAAILRRNRRMSKLEAEVKRLRKALQDIVDVPADWGNESYDHVELAEKALEASDENTERD